MSRKDEWYGNKVEWSEWTANSCEASIDGFWLQVHDIDDMGWYRAEVSNEEYGADLEFCGSADTLREGKRLALRLAKLMKRARKWEEARYV